MNVNDCEGVREESDREQEGNEKTKLVSEEALDGVWESESGMIIIIKKSKR
jgi:hypothetical protein